MGAEHKLIREFVFVDPHDKNDLLQVKIPERAEAAYGMYVWPCAAVLAQYIWHNRKDLLLNKNVLELGAGTALPSIVAIKCGKASSVTLTDDSHQPRCINNCRLSCTANSIPLGNRANNFPCKHSCPSIRVEGLRWGEVPPGLFYTSQKQESVPWPDIILGSDCFFDDGIYEKIFFTIRYLFDGKISNGKIMPRFLFTYQIRNAKSNFEDLLQLWGLTCTEIPLSSFEADVQDISKSGLPGNHEIKMFEIKP